MGVDVGAYLERIGYRGPSAPSLDFLRALHRLHPMAIPFENLSTLIGDPVPLDLDRLAHKLVERRRGGYCFEQNRLFAGVLEAVGFDVVPLAARVVWNVPAGAMNPRTHMVLLVSPDDTPYVCDVGFGGVTATAPLELVAERVQETPHEHFRVLRDGPDFELQVRLGDRAGGEWRSMYRFDLQRQSPVDYEMANHYVATHPDSHFRTRLTVARAFDSGRYALANDELTTYDRQGPTTRRLESSDEIKAALADVFGIDVPESERLDTALARVLRSARGA